MKIFSDFHHQGLAESLRLLFEERLGHTLYFPTGIEWFDDNYWHIGDCYGTSARTTALQFLTKAIPHDGTAIVTPHRTITLEQFKETKFDIILCTHEANIGAYQELIKLYQPQVKFIFQVGNEWSIPDVIVNVMASIAPFKYPKDKNVVFYHQEFKIPQYAPPPFNKTLTTFVNALPQNEIFRKDYEMFLLFGHLLPNFKCKSYGGGCRDGSVLMHDVPKAIQDSQFIFHLKSGGDGYGHIIHQAIALGRPVIYRGSQYKDKLAGKLLSHCLTGFDLDHFQPEVLADLLNKLDYQDMLNLSTAALERFKEEVDFELDALSISSFLNQLV